ncbi:uncharacterized protein LOC133529783 isoform X2 [Cydia pomonella]|uniref:uncharacterized protein LOC133529783 isoform X2 n=1 Tax=Cydia pomonella TaxID=82600 RepID=UPI002ADE0E3E|nr:uncharacterized protein LOC133529783 isoform X2 [Cydia pomonella]
MDFQRKISRLRHDIVLYNLTFCGCAVMFLWLLLLIGSQIWCLAVCPPVHEQGKGCELAKELINVNKTRVRYRRILQDLTRKNESSGRRNPYPDYGNNEHDSAEKTVTTTESSNITKLYWNVTHERCDYERIRCLRAYATGAVCARTLYYNYYSFPNYCTLEYHNCISRYEGIWTIAYMGLCTEVDLQKEIYGI